jgi:3-hydroxyisobutyrate dehydrogenase-like beta-hydroxyacid dehydrogenase
MKVGFIGLGNMGSAMAANLLKAGHEVAVYNRTASKADDLVKQGAHRATQIADACKGEAVLTMLADDPALESVVLGDGGVANNLSKGAIHISLSTISVALAQKLTAAHAERGQHFVSAPVFGRPEAAAIGKLFVTAAGEDEAVTKCLPLFDAIGQKTFRFGTNPSHANLVKISGNFLISCVIESLAEALALVGKAGIDERQYLDFLTSSLFTAPVYKTYGTIIVEKKYEPAGFVAPLGFKDNRLTLAAGQDLKVPLPLASLIYNRFLSLLANGGEKLDWSAIAFMAAKDAGEGKKTA